MELARLRATVVGAGIGGAATALLLARAGADVTLVERVAEPRAVGAGILLQPNGLAVLYGLGLHDAITTRGCVAREGAILDERGEPLVHLDTFDFGNGLDHFVALRRSTLFDALIGAVEAEPGITTRFGVEVRGVADADLADAELVVGADGVRSAVRAGADIRHRSRRTGVRYVRGLVFGELVTALGEQWTRLGLFGMAPVGGMTYFFGGTAAPVVAEAIDARDLDALRAAWAEVLPAAGELLTRVNSFDDLIVNEVETVRCRRFARGRVALLGDAAHAMYPNAGQGANSALVDAAVLVRSIRAHLPDVDAALRTYSRRRVSRVHRVHRDSQRLARLASLRWVAARRARDLLVRRMGRRGPSRRRFVRTMQEDPAQLLREVHEISDETGTPPPDPISA